MPRGLEAATASRCPSGPCSPWRLPSRGAWRSGRCLAQGSWPTRAEPGSSTWSCAPGAAGRSTWS
eukprot:9083208-Lingulodinium_polyedra.AAC.1